jgi:hypothetical protein
VTAWLVVEDQGRVAVVRGYRGAEHARAAGCKPIWVGSVKGWMIDGHRLPDLLAYLDGAHVPHRVTVPSEVTT